MRRLNRRKRPNRPHISSDIQFSKSAKTKLHEPPVSQRISPAVSSGSLAVTCVSASSSEPSVLPRRIRFGEAVFRPTLPNPQEEKTLDMTFSCQPQCLLGFSAVLWQSFATHHCPRNSQTAKRPPALRFRPRIPSPDG